MREREDLLSEGQWMVDSQMNLGYKVVKPRQEGTSPQVMTKNNTTLTHSQSASSLVGVIDLFCLQWHECHLGTPASVFASGKLEFY